MNMNIVTADDEIKELKEKLNLFSQIQQQDKYISIDMMGTKVQSVHVTINKDAVYVFVHEFDELIDYYIDKCIIKNIGADEIAELIRQCTALHNPLVTEVNFNGDGVDIDPVIAEDRWSGGTLEMDIYDIMDIIVHKLF